MTRAERVEQDVLWLAGWLEGEGSFGYWGRRRKALSIQARSTDLDVVEKAARIMGSTLNGPYHRPRCKPVYSTAANGDAAAYWMDRLLPFMSERRANAIAAALTKWSADGGRL